MLRGQRPQELLGVAQQLGQRPLDAHELVQVEGAGGDRPEAAAPAVTLPAKRAVLGEPLGRGRRAEPLLEPAFAQREHALEAGTETASAGHGRAL